MPWLIKNIEKLRETIRLYGNLDKDELNERYRLIDESYNKRLKDYYAGVLELEKFMDFALPVSIAIVVDRLRCAQWNGTSILQQNSLYLKLSERSIQKPHRPSHKLPLRVANSRSLPLLRALLLVVPNAALAGAPL